MIRLKGRQDDEGDLYLDELKIEGLLVKPDVVVTKTIRILYESFGGIDIAVEHKEEIINVLKFRTMERSNDSRTV